MFGKAVETLIQLLELTGGPVPAHFTTPETRSVQVATEWLGSDHDVTRLLRRGIAVHHGQLPDAVKSAMETDFRERRYRVIVATSTLAQGVNLPLRTVIIHSCWRSDATSRERPCTRLLEHCRAGRPGTRGNGRHRRSCRPDRPGQEGLRTLPGSTGQCRTR